jgi:CheY-like chemotaxis protein
MAGTLALESRPEAGSHLLVRLLENSGNNIVEASTARPALALMRKQHPDLVLMDIHMPLMSGDEVIQLMKGNTVLAPIPVIAITTNAVEAERERLLAIGAQDFISKQPAATILVVDDNRANQQLLLSQLQHLGLSADVAANGEQGYAMYHDKRHQLVFSDCNMPVMDGFAMTQLIRNDEKATGLNSHCIVIGITGSPEEFRQRCFDCGMDHVIGKPLLLNTLRDSLHKFGML